MRELFLLSPCAELGNLAGMSLLEEMTGLAQRAKEASRALARLTTEEKNRCLMAMAEAVRALLNGGGIAIIYFTRRKVITR